MPRGDAMYKTAMKLLAAYKQQQADIRELVEALKSLVVMCPQKSYGVEIAYALIAKHEVKDAD